MVFNQLEDANALLLYRVGPVLMCSPTLQVESVIVPPAISRASAVSEAEPGMFKSMYGMVRVVDLRVRFGVDAAQRKQPGQIIIVEVTGGHAGFWVDEIEDVTAFPQTGWSQAPSQVPGSVFSRALMQGTGIRLYAEFDRLDGFKASGYLREHIRSLQQSTPMEKTAAANNSHSPAQTKSPALQSKPDHTRQALAADVASRNSVQQTGRSGEASTLINASASSPESLPVKSPVKPAAMGDNNRQYTAANRFVSTQQNRQDYRPTLNPPSAAGGVAQSQKKTDRQTHQPSQKVRRNDHNAAMSSPGSNESIAAFTQHKTGRAGSDDLPAHTAPTTVESKQAGAGWLWWFVPLLLLFVVLFMLMQNSRPLQRLLAPDESPALQARVDLQQDTAVFQKEEVLDNDVVQYNSPADTAADIEIEAVEQMADDLTDVIYIEPDSGDLTITVNDYEEDSRSEYKETDDKSLVEVSAQSQMTAQTEPDSQQQALRKMPPRQHDAERQYATEQQQSQPLAEDKTAGTESMQADTKQQAVSTQNDERGMQKLASAETEVSDRRAAQSSRRLQHIVVKGDTLWSITGRYINKPWRYPEIARLSNIDNPHLIYPGQRVIIVLNYKKGSE